MRLILPYALVFLIFSCSRVEVAPALDQDNFKAWEELRSPFPGVSEAIGGYSAGCLAGGQQLEKSGRGFHLMRLSRDRDWGHPILLRFIRELGAHTQKQTGKSLLVGDLGRVTGGPTISGHMSHQTGLDVDIWFHLTKKTPTAKERETWSAPDRVKGTKLHGWTKDFDSLLKRVAEDSRVDRVFVNPAIKKHLCRMAGPGVPWLRKIRPWWGHSDHLHVRLKCSSTDKDCVTQEAIDPAEDHCGLDWWFSEEARVEFEKRKAEMKDRPFPDLPKRCRDFQGISH